MHVLSRNRHHQRRGLNFRAGAEPAPPSISHSDEQEHSPWPPRHDVTFSSLRQRSVSPALFPPTAERIAVVQRLDQEVSAKTVLDPAAFATEVDGILGGKLDDEWLRAINEAAFFNFVMGAYSAGIRHGAAYEGLRRTVIGEVVQCKDCWGVGATKHRDVCASCGGTGTVALKA